MNLFTVLLPYLILIVVIFLLKPFMCLSKKLAKVSTSAFYLRVQMGAELQRNSKSGNHNQIKVETVIRLIIFGLFCFTCFIFFASFSHFLIKPKTTENYQSFIRKANTVIAFGFGIDENAQGQLSAGKANDSIMKWVLKNTNPKFIIAQKGCAISKYIDQKTRVIDMHLHGSRYINTSEAASFALQKLDSLSATNSEMNDYVVIVAHDYQLQRAAWIIQKLHKKERHKLDYKFIIPEIVPIPFPSSSNQFHTKNRYIYSLFELFISRPRDYFMLLFG
jgi:hypothetical protein